MSTAFSKGRLPFCSLVNGGRTRTTTYSEVVSGLSEAVSPGPSFKADGVFVPTFKLPSLAVGVVAVLKNASPSNTVLSSNTVE